MPFDFPSGALVGDEYTSGNVTYVWNGFAWDLKSGGAMTDYVQKAGDVMTGNLEVIAPAKVFAKGNPPAGTGLVSLAGGDVNRTGMIEFLSPSGPRLARFGWGTATEIEFQFENGNTGIRMINGGIHWGVDSAVADKYDLSKGICLYGYGGTPYGFSVSASSLNYLCPSAAGHKFSCGTKSCFEIYDDTVYVNCNFTVNGVITDNLGAKMPTQADIAPLLQRIEKLEAEVATLRRPPPVPTPSRPTPQPPRRNLR